MSSSSSRFAQQLEVGDTLDNYIIHERIREGAMATLYLAHERRSGKEYVLKVPCSDILNKPIVFYHFQNEARISPLLAHPGIIRFVQQQKSRLYIIMEYVNGKDLRSMVAKGHVLGLDTALQLIRQLCEVAAYLHDNSILHLDLKPENILCCQDSRIRVIDFGLASHTGFPDLLSLDFKNPQGTPWYIAPEQLLGQRADPRCDIYSIGMLLYEMLTGCLPWPRSGKLQVARRRLRHDPAPPRAYNPEIPPQIQDIILRAIARKAENRYSTIGAMQNDLSNWRKQPVTPTGSSCKKPPLWRQLLPHPAIKKEDLTPRTVHNPQAKPQIIGALIDSGESDAMLAEVKKSALLRSAEVTLVHVIEEEGDSHFRRYGITVEGENLMARLEQAMQILQHSDIEPTVRLIRGEVVEVLCRLCKELHTCMLVIGTSRKKDGFLRSASVLRRLEQKGHCPLRIARESAKCV